MSEFAGRPIPGELKEIVDPKRTALLVWDMQNGSSRRSHQQGAWIRNPAGYCGGCKAGSER